MVLVVLPLSQAAHIDQLRINRMPAALMRRYDVYIVPEKYVPGGNEGKMPQGQPIIPMRQVTAEHIGKLVKVKVRAVSRHSRHLRGPAYMRILSSELEH